MDERLHKCNQWLKGAVGEIKASALTRKAASNSKAVLYGVALTCLTVWLFSKALRYLRLSRARTPSTPELEKAPSSIFRTPPRQPGGQSLSMNCEEVSMKKNENS